MPWCAEWAVAGASWWVVPLSCLALMAVVALAFFGVRPRGWARPLVLLAAAAAVVVAAALTTWWVLLALLPLAMMLGCAAMMAGCGRMPCGPRAGGGC